MGKIYNDEDLGRNPEIKDMINNLLNVGYTVDGKSNIKFRDTEINRVYNIMDRSYLRAVMLVGDFGSGKRSIIEGYVNKLERNARNNQVIAIDFDEFIKEAQRGDFGQIMNGIFSIANNNQSFGITLVIHNIGHLLNLNCYGNAGYSFINNMVKKIEEEHMKVIVTVTNDEYKTVEDSFNRVLDYFTVIKLSELSVEQTREIIDDEMSIYEAMYNMNFDNVDNISEIICTNADKYIKGKPFPGKAEGLFDEVCASIVNKFKKPDPKYIKMLEMDADLKNQLGDAMDENDYKRCDILNKKITNNVKKMDAFLEADSDDITIFPTEADILEAIGEIVGVKMSKLSKDQTAFLREMPDELKKNVIGQDDAVDTIVKNIRRNQLGLRKTSHSAGNFMFIGSTGVGKTYLAKQLAKYLYGSEENLLRLDMSEFQAEIDVSKLLGSAPGYVGYKESGLLVKGLAKKPETVVLFDEIEKAHPKIYDVLLQLLDEGFVTGSDGKKVDATKALIIFTSNIGVKQAMEMSSPLGFSTNADDKKNERKEQIIRKALKNRFSPEFLNRLDNICYFNSLSEDTLRSILQKELEETNTAVKGLTGKTIALSQTVEDWIIDKVVKEDNGARPIIRILQQNIEEVISDMIINEDEVLNSRKKTLVAELEDDKIVLK